VDFAPDPRTAELAARLEAFLYEHVYPAEPVLAEQLAGARDPWATAPVVARLRAEAREQGLWNLFLTGAHGPGLTNAQYAPLAELTGRSPALAPLAVNCAAPDTGNMELLAAFGTPEQQRAWLHPLLEAEIRSAFCMTEPDVASSDAGNIALRIERCDGGYRLTGSKWWASGAMHPACAVLLVLGRSVEHHDPHRRHSIVLVPRDTPGVKIHGALSVLGHLDHPGGGHARVDFDDVVVPAGSLLGEPGAGFAMAQTRLAAGRIHHCMRLIGMAERALELMCGRLQRRTAFGAPLAEHELQQARVARARVEIEQARLLVLKTAWLLDTVGARGSQAEVHAMKIAAPAVACRVIDDAIQAHGAAGLSEETPLALLYTHARALRIADGPDEVHLRALGRRELARQERRRGAIRA
jgi:acyl-CoA dehydrogenase